MNTEQERADFEAWVRRDMPRLSLRLVDYFMGYTEKETQTAFLAYQAGRAALHSHDRGDVVTEATGGDENGGHHLVEPDRETALALADAPRSLRNYVAALRSAIALQSQDAEDAQRYRKLRAMATQQADSLGPIFRIDVRRSAPYLFNFDAAIDHARRVEGDASGH